jgi:hypothetical protein
LTCLLSAPELSAQVSVLTYRNDNNRSGANLNKTLLNTSNVNSLQFGKLFALSVDGQIFAQPLYVLGVAIPGMGTHNVVFVATENNTMYAFDVDQPGAPLWQNNLGTPNNCFPNIFPVLSWQDYTADPVSWLNVFPLVGINRDIGLE